MYRHTSDNSREYFEIIPSLVRTLLECGHYWRWDTIRGIRVHMIAGLFEALLNDLFSNKKIK